MDSSNDVELLSCSDVLVVYECTCGCVHMRIGMFTLNLTREEFREFAKSVGEASVRLTVRDVVDRYVNVTSSSYCAAAALARRSYALSFRRQTEAILLFGLLTAAPVAAQERAYFVTYDHYLEERGNLEIAVANTSGLPRGPRTAYHAPWLELEYGVTGWWTTELYLEGVTTRRDGRGFTGWRWEHRFRPLKSEHRVNPVLYVEYEAINEATRIQKEIVGSGSLPFEPIDELRREHAHELETKLILSSAVRGWNISENMIFEKNLSAEEGVEFGYAVGVSRPLGGLASGASCRLCLENFVVGIEAYGGLGSTKARGLGDTRHFLAPVIAWHVTDRATLKTSTAFGLTDASDRYLIRVGFAYELPIGGRR